MDRLLSIEVFGVLHAETEEIAQLGGRVNLGLPGILSLAVHGQGHDVVAILGGDKIRGLEEDAGAFSERGLSPGLTGLQSGVDGRLDVSGTRIRVSRQGGMGRGVRLSEGLRGFNLELGLLETRSNISSGCGITHLLAGNDQRDVEGSTALVTGEGILETFAVGSAWGVVLLSIKVRRTHHYCISTTFLPLEVLTLGSLSMRGTLKVAKEPMARVAVRGTLHLEALAQGRALVRSSIEDCIVIRIRSINKYRSVKREEQEEGEEWEKKDEVTKLQGCGETLMIYWL